MAITNFIPTIWSEHFVDELAHKRIGVNNCNRVYEGEIREKGSTVKVCGLLPVTISDYKKNTDIEAPSLLNEFHNDLVINQAKYFNFMIDDIDRVQADSKLLNLAISNATSALAREADKYVYTLYEKADQTFQLRNPSPEQILDLIIESRAIFQFNGVTDLNDVIIEVSPTIANRLLKAKLSYGIDTSETMENGCIGRICGSKVFVSPDITLLVDGCYECSQCIMRTKRAIAFAEQFSEIEAYRPESRFADAVKGLYLFGAAAVVPTEMVTLDIGVETL